MNGNAPKRATSPTVSHPRGNTTGIGFMHSHGGAHLFIEAGRAVTTCGHAESLSPVQNRLADDPGRGAGESGLAY